MCIVVTQEYHVSTMIRLPLFWGLLGVWTWKRMVLNISWGNPRPVGYGYYIQVFSALMFPTDNSEMHAMEFPLALSPSCHVGDWLNWLSFLPWVSLPFLASWDQFPKETMCTKSSQSLFYARSQAKTKDIETWVYVKWSDSQFSYVFSKFLIPSCISFSKMDMFESICERVINKRLLSIKSCILWIKIE